MDINFGSSKKERVVRAPKERKSGGGKKRVKLIVISAVLAVILIAVGVYFAITTANGNRILNFSVSSTPNVTNYLVGEELDVTGLDFLVTRVNGTFYHVGVDEVSLRGFDSSKANDALTVYADYTVDGETLTASFTVKIKATQVGKEIIGIEYVNPKTDYFVGDDFVHQGTLYIVYKDQSRQALTMKYSYVKDTFDTSVVSDSYAVTVKCKLEGKNYYCTYNIVVTEK